MSNTGGFQNERTTMSSGNNAVNNIADDPNSNSDVKPVSIFSNDYKKHDDLRQMLDSNKENLKLDAMKRIVGMIAKGKNASDLFPAVVKNVVSKNVEIKKLVYVYLMRYAEEQQDLALLSISTFQRALKDPNQLIRASALRVLSSIRVPIITTIMMLAIKEAVSDMSPYVRKTAANAITKLYNLEPDLKDELIEIIEKLLADKTILVAGSAIQAFEEVCPDRIDLIHKNYRKLCNLLIDVDEWGQVVIINMLTRYARTQFVSPDPLSSDTSELEKKKEADEKEKKEAKTNENGDEDEDEEKDDDDDDFDSKFKLNDSSKISAQVDPDHRLLLRVTKPLLQSRNSAVVMAVAQLYYYVAPKSEAQIIAKSLVRLLRSHREVQIIVLKNIVSMAQKNHSMFQPHQKSFFVHSNDSIHVKLLKLEILTCLANESNISIILREFQAYVLSNDKEFAAATINAIGRCASNIKEVSENCLTGLVNLMSKKDETIVAESVVVIKRLLQSNPSKNGHIIKKMAKMTDKITVASARASIIWLIGEYSDRVPKLAPDVLRKMAKTFCDEENTVKLQVLNLAAKLFVTNHKQVSLLTQYVLNLAKYDQNYDIRDRARFLRALLISHHEKCPSIGKHGKKILLAPKPAPLLQSAYKDTDQYQLGTLSHALSMRVSGYADLPEFPGEAPDPTVRNIELPPETKNDMASLGSFGAGSDGAKKRPGSKSEKFYSDEDDEEKSQSTEGADPTNDEEDEEEEESETESDEDEEESSSEEESEDSDEEDEEEGTKNKKKASKAKAKKSASEESESETQSGSESEESSSESSSSSEEDVKKKPATKPAEVKKPETTTTAAKKTTSLVKKVESSESESETESESESSSTEPEEKPVAKNTKPAATKKQPEAKPAPPAPVVEPTKKQKGKKETTPAKKEVSLLDLDFSEPSIQATSQQSTSATTTSSLPILSPSLADLANISASSIPISSAQTHVSKKEYELLSKINGNGLQISYRFTRAPNKFSPKAVTIELKLSNFSNGDFSGFHVANKKLQSGMSMSDLAEFDLPKGTQSCTQIISIDFNETLQAAQFELAAIYSNDPSLGGTSTSRKWPGLSITCPIGELVQPGWGITENEFNRLQANLKGMNEVSAVANDLSHALFISKNVASRLLDNLNICQIPSSQQDTIKYAALTFSTKTPLLCSLFFPAAANRCQINVNCEKIVLANMFIKEIKQLLVV